MKRLKGVFVLLIVLIMGFVVNVNADSCHASGGFVYNGESVIKPGDEFVVTYSNCVFNTEDLITVEFKYDKELYTLVSDNVLGETNCLNVKKYTYKNDPGNYEVVFNVEKRENCVGTHENVYNLVYELKVNDVPSQVVTLYSQKVTIDNPNMPADIKSPNNFLKSLVIDGINQEDLQYGESGFGFNKITDHYYSYVNYDTKNVVVKAEAEDEKGIVLGLGEKELLPGTNLIKVVVIAENGDIKTYEITLYKWDEEGNFVGNTTDIVKTFEPSISEINEAKKKLGLDVEEENPNQTTQESDVINQEVETIGAISDNGKMDKNTLYLYISIGVLSLLCLILFIIVVKQLNDRSKNDESKEDKPNEEAQSDEPKEE